MSQPTAISSGLIEEDTQITNNRAILTGARATEGTIRVYDGEDDTGVLLVEVGDSEGSVDFSHGVRAYEGLYVEFEGEGSRGIVWYK